MKTIANVLRVSFKQNIDIILITKRSWKADESSSAFFFHTSMHTLTIYGINVHCAYISTKNLRKATIRGSGDK